MKKIIIGVILMTSLISMIYAQVDIKPYGSARVGYWYESLSKEMTSYQKEDMDLNYMLQSNSRFGVNFKNDKLTAKVEYGTGVNLRLLWVKQDMGSYSVLIGQDYDGTSEYSAQVYSTDKGLIEFGAVDGGRNPQIKLEMKNGFYVSLIKPNTLTNPAGYDNKAIDLLIPKINLGFKYKYYNFYSHPTLVFQTYSFDKNFPYMYAGTDSAKTGINESVNSWLFAYTGQINIDDLMIRGHVNYGSNTGYMGYNGPSNSGYWDATRHEITNTTTMGGFFEFGYKLNSQVNINTGVGYEASSNDKYLNNNNKKVSDEQMSAYAQIKFQVNKFMIIPEIGLLDYMNSISGEKQGSLMYFGTQLRMDF